MTAPSTMWPTLSWSCISIRCGMAALFIVNNPRPETIFSRDNGVVSHMILARCGHLSSTWCSGWYWRRLYEGIIINTVKRVQHSSIPWIREVQCSLHLAADSMSTRGCTCFPFLAHFPSAISTKCKLLHTMLIPRPHDNDLFDAIFFSFSSK